MFLQIDMEGSEGSPPPSMCVIRTAAEVFPKETTEKEDNQLVVQFQEREFIFNFFCYKLFMEVYCIIYIFNCFLSEMIFESHFDKFCDF